MVRILLHIVFSLLALQLGAQSHPTLTMTQGEVSQIRSDINAGPLFQETLQNTIKEVDREIEIGVQVPVPKDMAGGYTHERHKKNFFILQKVGALYQITQDDKYADYVKESFMAYAQLYPTLSLHPTNRSYATGKIFWQCLNDSNWLVYCSQAYDCIYDYLSAAERAYLNTTLFRPMADFLSVGNPQFFNRVHNHSTWANAAVGMIGLVMDDEELIQRALYGLQDDGIDKGLRDNDGGYIKSNEHTQAGFFAQLDYSFSPDGHFTEGPYYLRYAMTPFLLFAKSLSNARPEMDIYGYRDGILRKSIYALINQTDAQGRFFPINDAQKGMSWLSREVVGAINIAYNDFGNDPMLLSIAQKQGRVLLDGSGFGVAKALAEGKMQAFEHASMSFNDGPEGDKGGLTILRAQTKPNDEILALVKYAAHGMGHGHFDRLSYSLTGEQREIIQDYGSARWVNIDQKGGGRYLKENQSFSKQTIAHNTLVANATSQNQGEVKIAEHNKAELYFTLEDDPTELAVSIIDSTAYDGITQHRTLILLQDELFEYPLLIDLFKVISSKPNTYDLPTWFKGHHLNTNWTYDKSNLDRMVLGSDHGYQHIWQEGVSTELGDMSQFSWFDQDRFFTLSTVTDQDDEIIFGRLGANDPEFNLRPDPVHILRRSDETNSLFVSTIEAHGTYDTVSETPLNPFSSIDHIEVLLDSENYVGIRLSHISGASRIVMVSLQDNNSESKHIVRLADREVKWAGPFNLINE
jgi:hypothetical protein